MPNMPFSRAQPGGSSSSFGFRRSSRDEPRESVASSDRASYGGTTTRTASLAPSDVFSDSGATAGGLASRITSSVDGSSRGLLGAWRRQRDAQPPTEGPSSGEWATEAQRVSNGSSPSLTARWSRALSSNNNDSPKRWPGGEHNQSFTIPENEAVRGPSDAYDRLTGASRDPTQRSYGQYNQVAQESLSPSPAQRGGGGGASASGAAGGGTPRLSELVFEQPEDGDEVDNRDSQYNYNSYNNRDSDEAQLAIPLYDARGYPIRYATPDNNNNMSASSSARASQESRSPQNNGPSASPGGGAARPESGAAAGGLSELSYLGELQSQPPSTGPATFDSISTSTAYPPPNNQSTPRRGPTVTTGAGAYPDSPSSGNGGGGSGGGAGLDDGGSAEGVTTPLGHSESLRSSTVVASPSELKWSFSPSASSATKGNGRLDNSGAASKAAAASYAQQRGATSSPLSAISPSSSSSGHQFYGVHGMTTVMGSGGEPRPAPESVNSGHDEAGRFSYHTTDTGRSSAFFATNTPPAGYADFSIDSKTARRQVVSMVSTHNDGCRALCSTVQCSITWVEWIEWWWTVGNGTYMRKGAGRSAPPHHAHPAHPPFFPWQ